MLKPARAIEAIQGAIDREKSAEYTDWTICMSVQFAEELIETLKAQEQQEPVPAELEGGGSSWWHVCGECHGWIDSSDSYCRHCGRRIKWDGD